jgi:hypothetical protein
MGRTETDNLSKAFVMAENGMPLRQAWQECSKLAGGATTWNVQAVQFMKRCGGAFTGTGTWYLDHH